MPIEFQVASAESLTSYPAIPLPLLSEAPLNRFENTRFCALFQSLLIESVGVPTVGPTMSMPIYRVSVELSPAAS